MKKTHKRQTTKIAAEQKVSNLITEVCPVLLLYMSVWEYSFEFVCVCVFVCMGGCVCEHFQCCKSFSFYLLKHKKRRNLNKNTDG